MKSRRAGKLNGPEKDLFSGEYWTGNKAKEFGLVDSIGDLRGFLRERFGEKVRLPLIADRGLFGRRVPGVFSDLRGAPDLAEDLVSAIEARAIWARYGL